MKFTIDKTGRLEKLFQKMIRKHFPSLNNLEFVFVWRDKEKYTDGQLVMAETSKLSARDRDLFGFDVRIEIDENNFPLLNGAGKRKVVFHELEHIVIDYEFQSRDSDDEGEVNPNQMKYDREGRLSFHVREHDLVLKRFESELWEFGLSDDEHRILNLLSQIKEYHENK